MYKLMYKPAVGRNKKGLALLQVPVDQGISGGGIRTPDLRVMSPTSYQAALPRDHVFIIPHPRGLCQTCSNSLPPDAVINYGDAPAASNRSLFFRPSTREPLAKFLEGGGNITPPILTVD